MNTTPKIPIKAIHNAIRKEFSRSELAALARNNYISSKVGSRGGKRFFCNICKKDEFPQNSIEVDHIDPVVPIGTHELEIPIDVYLDRTFCPLSNLQVLCKICHKVKSKQENAERILMRKVKDIKKCLPEDVTIEEIVDFYNSLPDSAKSVKGFDIGVIMRLSIRWYIERSKKPSR